MGGRKALWFAKTPSCPYRFLVRPVDSSLCAGSGYPLRVMIRLLGVIQPPAMGEVIELPEGGELHHRYERRAA